MTRRWGIRRAGRGVGALLADFGHPLPPAALATGGPVDDRLFTELVRARGHRRPGAGWAAVPAPLAVYRMTSEQVGGVWPLIASDCPPPTGALMGIDYLSGGGAFHADPVGWTLSGFAGVTNPNVIVFGAPGYGKTGTVKMLALRLLPYGYRVLVLGDVKDEYEVLCRAFGVEPHAVGVGLPVRINPLDFGPLGHDWTHLGAREARRRAGLVFSRWLTLLRALVDSQHVGFGPTAERVLGEVLRDLTGYTTAAQQLAPVTIPLVWQALNHPSDRLLRECRYATAQQLLDELRPVRDALGALVSGHLAGLFDEASSIAVDWRAPIQSLSLSRLAPLGDEAVGVALTCLNSWGRAMREVADPGDRRVVIRDECWKQMRLGTAAVASLDADLRLSRSDGDVQVAIAHKPGDMLTVGDAGSQAVAIATDLIHLCSTKILAGQDDKVGDDLAALLGLSGMAERVVTQWATAKKGRALWVVGNRQYQVQTLRTPTEEVLTDSNAALRATAAA